MNDPERALRVKMGKSTVRELIAALGQENDPLQSMADAGTMIMKTIDEFGQAMPGMAAILLPAMGALSRARELMGDTSPDGTWEEFRAILADLAVDSIDAQVGMREAMVAAIRSVMGGPQEES